MVGLLTRRLLRDWKQISRHYQHIRDKNSILFHLKPQDSNLHVWHLVINQPLKHAELYLRLFVGSEEEPSIILRCLTPNNRFPVNRNISLTHLNYLLIDYGFFALLQRIWKLFFEHAETLSAVHEQESRFCFAWNRIVCRDFKLNFPELVGCLAPGDYEMIKDHSKRIGQSTHQTRKVGSNTTVDNGSTDESYNESNLIACDDSFARGANPFSKRRWSGNVESDDFEVASTLKRARK
ncbi:hypothetical protein HG535_0H02960 [Zygotorulaspora mrakii]|uniref:Uncharacterized protein n=1 Tax=Zygotorulaspora mrakii TaxID=42260 RepID=A0A7H9BAC0_ZYGMR|nr:uncharacterized protein HG535_0H02960 [Zygotorulaspora mrakii]QLG74969.1 hypothetical protein HG535_0H02960 [Zygotorulaspora mrakii]